MRVVSAVQLVHHVQPLDSTKELGVAFSWTCLESPVCTKHISKANRMNPGPSAFKSLDSFHHRFAVRRRSVSLVSYTGTAVMCRESSNRVSVLKHWNWTLKVSNSPKCWSWTHKVSGFLKCWRWTLKVFNASNIEVGHSKSIRVFKVKHSKEEEQCKVRHGLWASNPLQSNNPFVEIYCAVFFLLLFSSSSSSSNIHDQCLIITYIDTNKRHHPQLVW